jgi:hypothetical protein
MQLIPWPVQHSESKNKKLNLTFKFIQNSILMGAGTVQLVKQVGYGLNSGGIGVRFPAGVRNYCVLRSVRIGFEA